jgi:hypothetical protein
MPGDRAHHDHRRPRQLVFVAGQALVGKEDVEVPIHRSRIQVR